MSSKQKVKNITNGEIQLKFDDDDVANNDMAILHLPPSEIQDIVKRSQLNSISTYYIENLRTGSFSQISENYLIQSRAKKDSHNIFTTNTFETQMQELRRSIQQKISKSISFFQGIFTGMALLLTITLNLSESLSRDLIRVQDQSIRVIGLLTALGSIFSMIRARERYDYIKLRGTSSQIDQRYKCTVLCIIQMIFYLSSYIVFNVSHVFSVQYNISGTNYSRISILTTVYTSLTLIGWIITNINSKKHDL